jgi:hypothetical protein
MALGRTIKATNIWSGKLSGLKLQFKMFNCVQISLLSSALLCSGAVALANDGIWVQKNQQLGVQRVSVGGSPATEKPMDYQIVKVWEPSTSTGIRFVFATIHPTKVNRESAMIIAAKVNKRFAKERQIKVFFWDDETDAKIYGDKLADEFSGFTKNLRMVYGVYRKRCVEFIDLYPDKSKPGYKETINIPCHSSAKRKRRQGRS